MMAGDANDHGDDADDATGAEAQVLRGALLPPSRATGGLNTGSVEPFG